MSMQDPISNMLTCIRNGQMVQKPSVEFPHSNVQEAIAGVLKSEGYITDFTVNTDGVKKTLSIQLKYHQGEPVIEMLKRVSKPSLRTYKNSSDIPQVRAGLGTVIISTSKGVMTGSQAKAANEGGEILCYVA